MRTWTVLLLCAAASAVCAPCRLPSHPTRVQARTACSLPALALRGGGGLAARSPRMLAAADEVAVPGKPERPLQAVAFIFVLSVSLVALAPTPYLKEALGTERATVLGSLLGSCSACAEIVLAPIVGSLSDSVGRKPVLTAVLLVVLTASLAVTAAPCIATVAAAKFVGSLVVGLFFLSSSAILGDAYRGAPKSLAAASGLLFALVNGGFGIGVQLSARLPAGLRFAYGASALSAASALVLARLCVRESLPTERRPPFKMKTSNLFGCVRLLRHGRQLKLLVLLIALTLQPLFMGDVLQLYAIDQWGINYRELGNFFSMIAVTGVLANSLGGACIKRIGITGFSLVATASNLLFWLGCMHSRNAALACAAIGLLGPARALGASTMITNVGAQKGIPLGQLAGDRANLMAILKIIGPQIYGFLYLTGKRVGTPALPFVLNAALMGCAMLLIPFAVGAAEGQTKKKT